ncbi:MAG TPA: GFA family protein [Herbaspirillum sp.]|jgi:hypothetical protein
MRYEGSCHCGNIAFEVEGDFKEAIDCNCSLCRRRGGLLAFVPRDQLTLKTPAANVSTYTFNHHSIQHHFCAKCGIAPFGEGAAPGGPPMASINLRCVPAVDLDTLKVTHYNGKDK